MNRYAAMFARLAVRRQGAFGGFLMLGDPGIASSVRQLDALVAGGADMIEVGIPFSDPVADGPVIQAAAARALGAGVRTADCFDLIAGFRARHPDVPIGILTYANVAMARGREEFFRQAAAAGSDSLLLADVPAHEAAPWARGMRAAGIAPVLIAAAATPPGTLRRIARLGQGYTYCVSRSGITGIHAGGTFDPGLIERLAEAGAPPPVFGFGIAAPAHVRAALDAGAAGVIAGSVLVDCVARGGDLTALVAALKAATRNESAPE